MKTRKLLIMQEDIPDYRVAFFNDLHALLQGSNVEMVVVSGTARTFHNFADGMDDLTCGRRVNNFHIGKRLYYQPVLRMAWAADIVVMQQELKSLVSYPLLVARQMGRNSPLLCLWGHGRDFQKDAESAPSRWLRNWGAENADHIFAYTELSRDAFVARGVEPGGITVVNNSKDTSAISRARQTMSSERRAEIFSGVGLDPEAPTAVFCSRLNDGKKLPFLIDAVRIARESIPNLQLLIIGDGPMMGWLTEQVRPDGWIKCVGSRFGNEQADVLAASDIFVMPAQIGLSILDAFAAGLPVLTTEFPGHGPEISYLKDGENGGMSAATSDEYAAGIVKLLKNSEICAQMRNAACLAADKYSLSAMVDNFARGVDAALAR